MHLIVLILFPLNTPALEENRNVIFFLFSILENNICDTQITWHYEYEHCGFSTF